MTELPWLAPAKAALNEAIEADRLGHAPMLLGAAGVGKRDLAAWLCARLLCKSPTEGEPCGRCDACQLMASGTHPDFFRLSPEPEKKEIRVDQVRAFIESVTLTPSIGEHRVGLVEPADRMNRNAANALLKTLEEPASGVWLVLVTDRPDRLPVTVRSRCQVVHVPVPQREAVEAWLAVRHPDAATDRRSLALALADGSPGQADAWLDGDGLARGLAIRDRLGALLQSGEVDPAVPADWVDDPDTTWTWLARWSGAWTKRARTGSAEGLGATAPIEDSDTQAQLQQLWDRALAGRSLAGDPVRHDWMLLEWLADWRRLAGRLPVAE